MSRPLRVLMVSDVYFPRINGVSTSIETFRAALPAHGVSVSLIAPQYDGETDEPGITRIRGRALPRDPEDRPMAYSRLSHAVNTAAQEHDLIHIQTPFAAHYAGLKAARRTGKPAVATYHTLFEEYLQHYLPFLPARLLRSMARRFSRDQCNALQGVVVPSTAMAQRLEDYGVSTPMHVLPTGLPQSAFVAGERERFRKQHGIASDTPVLLFVGRVAHEKNIAFLLDVLAVVRQRHPSAILLITGEGPAVPDLRRRTTQMGLTANVRFLGYLDRRTTLPDAYASADVFVFASHTETQGLVLLEAMAQGCPVVGIPIMGTRDILGPGLGCIPAPDDLDDFSNAVNQVLEDSDLRARLAREARDYAQTWSDDTLARRLADLYRSLVR